MADKECSICLKSYPLLELSIRTYGRYTNPLIEYTCQECKDKEFENILPDPDEPRKTKRAVKSKYHR